MGVPEEIPAPVLSKKERQRLAGARWHAKNPEKLRIKWRNRYWRNPEKMRAKQRARINRDHEAHLAKRRVWNLANRDKILEQRRIDRIKNPAKFRAWQHARYLRDKAKILEKTKAYRIAHPEISLKAQRTYRAKHPAKVISQYARRRALKKSAADNFKALTAWMENIRAQKFATCYYCEKVIPSSQVHFDHIVPIVKGGQHTPENLCVSCAPCNQKKGAKLISVWVKPGQQLLVL